MIICKVNFGNIYIFVDGKVSLHKEITIAVSRTKASF